MNVQVQGVYNGDYHNLSNESGFSILLRSALPFKIGNLNHIARATLPIVTDTPSGADGRGDLVLFDLIAFDEKWGRWGLGPVLLTPTGADGITADNWAV